MQTRLVEKQVLYKGAKVRLEVHHLKDENDRPHTREVVVHPGAAVILPILPDNQILMIKTYRYCINEYLLELPAGTMDAGETPINCAGRELMEETGYIASKLSRLGMFYSSPGVLTERVHAFLATGLLASAGPTDETEEIKLCPMDRREVMRAVFEGEITDAKTITALLLFENRRKAGH